MQHSLTTNHFWQFSLEYYGKSPHAEVLLLLQDKHGANINLCLLLKYLESLKLSIKPQDLALLHKNVMSFSEHHTKPLRALRKQYKKELSTISAYSELRQHLLSAELALEKQEQALLLDKITEFQLQKSNQPAFISYLSETLKLSKTDLDQTLSQLTIDA